jgi:hypothetical protein
MDVESRSRTLAHARVLNGWVRASAKKIDPSSLTELHLVADAERSC